MVDVNYVDYNIFGQLPSLNFRFNLMVGDENIPTSPYFMHGIYYQYYCLISDLLLYGAQPLLQEVNDA